MQSKSNSFLLFFISLGRMDRQSLGNVLDCFYFITYLLINYPENLEKLRKNICMFHIKYVFSASLQSFLESSFTPFNTRQVIMSRYSEVQVYMNSLRCLCLSIFFFPKLKKNSILSRTCFKY